MIAFEESDEPLSLVPLDGIFGLSLPQIRQGSTRRSTRRTRGSSQPTRQFVEFVLSAKIITCKSPMPVTSKRSTPNFENPVLGLQCADFDDSGVDSGVDSGRFEGAESDVGVLNGANCLPPQSKFSKRS